EGEAPDVAARHMDELDAAPLEGAGLVGSAERLVLCLGHIGPPSRCPTTCGPGLPGRPAIVRPPVWRSLSTPWQVRGKGGVAELSRWFRHEQRRPAWRPWSTMRA